MAGLPEINVTFDVDLTDYASGTGVQLDELEAAFAPIFEVLEETGFQTRWYLRLDAQMEAVYGAPDYLFQKHSEKIRKLKEQGHLIGWHYHAYVQDGYGKWVQNIDEKAILEEVNRLIPYVKQYELQDVRIGWGYQTNRLMGLLDRLGFESDSSAIPRPNYPWSAGQSDWTISPQAPYYPARNDYRQPSPHPEKNLRILEIPMSTAKVTAPYDKDEVIRYLNPAYHPEIFQKTLDSLKSADYPVLTLITHPYELLPNEKPHGLLSFSLEAFRRNLLLLAAWGRLTGRRIRCA